MVARLGEVLLMPLEARNQMLTAAGYAPRYTAAPLSDAAMAPVMDAVRWMLDRHAPYPALAFDRLWTVTLMNAPAARFFGMLGVREGDSLLDLITDPRLPDMIENWPEVARHSAARLRTESAAAGGIAELDRAAEYLAQAADPQASSPGPMIPTVFRTGDARLALFSTIAQFGTPTDVTLDDVRIELFFPTDSATETALRGLAQDQR
jgi:hypothetical protein